MLKIILVKDSSKDKDIRLFVRRYNQYMRKNGLNHYDNNLMKLRKSNLPKKEQRQVTCYECGKSRYYKIDCLSLVKRKDKQPFYKTKRKMPRS